MRKPSRQNVYPTSRVNRAPRALMSLADRGATSTMRTAAGMIDNPESSVEYPSTFCRNCWPMNIAAISEPNTTIPAQAATQKTLRAATCRS